MNTKLYDEKHGRNYTYRIPLSDNRDAKNARRRIETIDRHGMRLIERDPDEVYTPMGYVSYRTRDSDGPLPSCGQYEYSPQWEQFPSGPGKYENLEMRNGSHGGTKLRGEVSVGYENDPAVNGPYVRIDTTVSFTPSEIKAICDGGADDSDRQILIDEIRWAVDDRVEELRDEHHEKRMNALDECDHMLEPMFGREYWCHRCEFKFIRDELVRHDVELPDE